MFVTDYKNDVIGEISKMRSEFLEINQDITNSVQFMRKKFDTVIIPNFEEMKETCRRTAERSERCDIKVD